MSSKWPLQRDLVLFIGGLAGVAHETLVSAVERPTLLMAFVAMMGLPAFLKSDERRNGSRDRRGRSGGQDDGEGGVW